MASSAWELVCVALPKYCSLVGVGRFELTGDDSGEASSGTIQRPVLVHFLPVSTSSNQVVSHPHMLIVVSQYC